MKALSDESGQALIFVALSLTGILGFVGLATDLGMLLHTKRNLQIAADSAAIAGASELTYSTKSTDVNAAGQAAAAQNGATNGSNGVTVTVNPSPLYGPNAGKAGYVEAIVSENQPVFFMKLFSWSSMTVNTRAVAFNGASTKSCVYVLDPAASQAMNLQGSFTVSVPSCGIVVDSSASNALNFTGSGGSLTAQSVGVVGLASGKTGDSTPAPVTGIAPVSDPFAGKNYPVYACTSGAGAICTTSSSGTPASVTCSDSTTTQPASLSGAVCYGLGATGKKGANDSITLTGPLNPGLYIINGDLTLNTVTGTGVTFYLTGNLTAANGTINLTAPDPGSVSDFASLAFYAPNDTGTLMFDFGSASGTVKGIIYAPKALLALHDSGGDTSGGLQLITDLIVGTLNDQTATLSLTSYSKTVAGSPLTSVALVE
jgi:Flp pilus assembly protein TadG